MAIRSLLTTTFLLVVICVQGQHYTLKGHVSDASGDSGLPYVNIFIEGTDYGTITNRNGDFEFLIYPQDYNKSVVFSFVGFKTKRLTCDTTNYYHVRMEESEILLQDFVVTPIVPEELINDFWHKIVVNYPDDPVVHRVYLREQEKFENDQELFFNEIMVDYYRSDYINPFKDKIRYVKGRGQEFIDLDSVDFLHLEGGSAVIFNDIVKYPRDFIKPGKLKGYHFEVEKVIEFEGDEIYHITFMPSENSNTRYKGSLFINKENHALVKAEISYSEHGLKWINSPRFTGRFKWHEVTNTLNYKKLSDNTYSLNEMIIKGVGEDPDFDHRLVSISELVVVDTHFNAKPEKKEFKRIDESLILMELGNFQDSDTFWNDKNHIKKEENVSAISVAIGGEDD